MTDLRSLLGKASALLLDFDGPICSTFHSRPADVVTAQLADTVRSHGFDVSDDVLRFGPHDFLAWVGETFPGLTEVVEERLTRAEESAVTTALPTPYASDAIRNAAASGLPVGIVSNNAASAIERYLTMHAIAGVPVVCGRPGARLDRMKPDPWSLLQTARLLEVAVEDCVLVGDSDTDVRAARAAGIPVVGYASSSRAADELTEAGADIVLDTMSTLAAAIRTR